MRRTLFITIATVLLGLLILFLVGPDAGSETTATPEPWTGYEFVWEPGTQYEYVLQYESDSRTAYPVDSGSDATGEKAALDVRTSLRGRLLLNAYGIEDGNFLLGWQLAGLDKASVVAFGAELLPSPKQIEETFSSREALVEVTPTGEIVGVHLKGNDPRLFRNLARLLIAEMQVRLPEGPETDWSIDERGYYGVTPSLYSVEGSKGNAWRLRKSRSAYTSLRGLTWRRDTLAQDVEYDSRVQLSEGRVDAFVGEERVRVRGENGESLFAVMTSVRQEFATARAIPQVDDLATLRVGRRRHQLDETTVDGQLERSLLESQADGLAWREVAALITRHGVTDKGSDFNKWLWRAVGLLKLQPELTERFVPLFEQEGLPQKSRQLILGVLGNVGHAEAQDVMLRILDSDLARNDADAFFHYIQRLSLVDQPTAETAEFAAAEYERAAPELRIATAYTFGNVIRGLDASDSALADELNGRLAADVQTATTVDTRRILLSALGATGRDENVDTITAFSSDADSTVRSAAARALVKTQTPTSEKVLLELAVDASTSVQRSALRTLTQYELSQEVLEEISFLVESGQVARSNFAEINAWVLPQIADRETVRRTAQHMLDHAPADARLESRLRKAVRGSS